MKNYKGDGITVSYDVRKCIHARRCILGLPGVFDSKARPWIQPDKAPAGEVVDVVRACPSGALQYKLDDGPEEYPAHTNTLRIWENGPLELRGELDIEGVGRTNRALLCRCGMTKNAPFCDNSHRKGFTATGVPGQNEAKHQDIGHCDGPVEVKIREDGPYMIRGRIEVIGGDGSEVAKVEKVSLCRCGAAGDKPFCTGNHRDIGFRKPVRSEQDGE